MILTSVFQTTENMEKMETSCYTISIEKLEDFNPTLSSVAWNLGKGIDPAEEPEEKIREIKELLETDNFYAEVLGSG